MFQTKKSAMNDIHIHRHYLLAYKTWAQVGSKPNHIYGNIWRKIPANQQGKYRQHHWYIEPWSEKKVNQLKAENKAKKLEMMERRNKVCKAKPEPYKSLFWPLVALYGLRNAKVIEVEVYCSTIDHNGNGFGNGKRALVFVPLHDPENAIGIIMDKNPMHRVAKEVERIPVHFREFHWLEEKELIEWLNNMPKYGRGYFYARTK